MRLWCRPRARAIRSRASLTSSSSTNPRPIHACYSRAIATVLAMPGAVALAPTLAAASSSAAAASTLAPNPTSRGDPLTIRLCRNAPASASATPLVPLVATRRYVRGCRGAALVASPHHAPNPRLRFASAAEGMAAEASTAGAASAAEAKPFAVLFVCLGQSPQP